jgi:ABC-2 type transport system permease protein
MRNPLHTPFGAIFQNEVLLNSKRIAPYAMAVLFGGNALLWWGWGPAAGRGWATNSEFFISGVLPVYSFMTLPLFTALIMADPVIRDFRTGIDPLIFAKPVNSAEYLLGKFFGNFFVLVCCQAAFVLTLFMLQAFRRPGMIVQGVTVVPYFKHFIVFVVISHLVPSAFYFTVGTLARNAKIVYGLGVSFYPLYITYQVVFLKSLPTHWRILLDPLLMNWGKESSKGRSAEWLNQLVISYDADLVANRAMMILFAAICLTVLYLRFVIAERPGNLERFSLLNLAAGSGGFYYDPPSIEPARGDRIEQHNFPEKVLLPKVTRASDGLSNLTKLIAALGVEFRLLLSERSLVVIMPLAIFLSTLDVAFWTVAPEPSLSAACAGHTAKALLLFLIGITIFSILESVHRDRDLKIEPLLWSQAAPNYVLLLSKFLATLVVTVGLSLLVGIVTIALQTLKQNGPVDLSAYLRIYGIIVLPNAIFLAAAVMAFSVLLRDRYLTYAVAVGTCAGLFYLYSQGHNGWLYNPMLYQLWRYSDLTGGESRIGQILAQRIHLLAIALSCLSLAHLFCRRPSNPGLLTHSRLTNSGWSIVLLFVSFAVAVVTALLVGDF